MSVMDTLITDRTQADYNRWKELKTKGLFGMTADELSEWLSGMKGAYNATDLNRVGEALIYLQNKLSSHSYSVTVNPKTNWSKSEIPSPVQMSAYISDVAKIRAVLSVPPDTPPVPPDMEGLTWQEANDIERILLDVDEMLTLMSMSFLRCGHTGVCCGARGLPTEGGVQPVSWTQLDALGWRWADWDAKTWFKLLYGR